MSVLFTEVFIHDDCITKKSYEGWFVGIECKVDQPQQGGE